MEFKGRAQAVGRLFAQALCCMLGEYLQMPQQQFDICTSFYFKETGIPACLYNMLENKLVPAFVQVAAATA